MTGHWADLIWAITFGLFMIWIFTAMGVGIATLVGVNPDRLAILRAVRAELRPFALPALLVSYAATALDGGLGPFGYFGLAANLYNWWYWYRDKDDDDRWKRRRQKLAAKVAEVGGKLQVVRGRCVVTGILLTCVVLILITGCCLYLVIARPDIVAAVVYRALRNADPWSRRSRLLSRLLVIKRADPEAFAVVPDPVDEHFKQTPGGSIYVQSDHPLDCANRCCWEIRLNELVAEYDWHAAEYEMRKTK